MFAVLEHIVRVHRRMDEGLENEVVVVLFVSSILCCGERMDDENTCLFESLQEGIDVFGREVFAVGRGGKVFRDSLVVKKYPPLRRPLGREGHKLVEPACEFIRDGSEGRFFFAKGSVESLRVSLGFILVNSENETQRSFTIVVLRKFEMAKHKFEIAKRRGERIHKPAAYTDTVFLLHFVL